MTTSILANCLICRPLKGWWDVTIEGSSCGNINQLGLYDAIFNFLLDALVVILPMPVLWRLQMPASRKVALTGMFGIGILYGSLISLSKQRDDPLRRVTYFQAQDLRRYRLSHLRYCPH